MALRADAGRGGYTIMLRITPFLVVAATGCLLFPVSRDEVSRTTSPSGRLDAVLVETNGGATTPFGYLVYVVPRGSQLLKRQDLAWLDAAVRNAQATGANLRWEGPSHLVVEYREARDTAVRKRTIVIGPDTVSVSLRSGVTDSSAPAGGMLYNLQKGRR